MDVQQVLLEGFDRVREVVHGVLDGAADDVLTGRPDGDANSVAWLLWHLTRVQDDHVSDAFDVEQVWTADGWAERFALDLPPQDTGYGHGPAEVAAVRASADLLAGYHDAVHDRTRSLLAALAPEDLDRVVDRSWDPPVTLGVRLVSVLSDDLQHAGQAAYARGLAERRAPG